MCDSHRLDQRPQHAGGEEDFIPPFTSHRLRAHCARDSAKCFTGNLI